MKKKLFIAVLISILVCTAVYEIFRYIAKDSVAGRIDQYVSMVDHVESIDYESLDVFLFDPGFTLENVSVLLDGLSTPVLMKQVHVRELKVKENLLLGLNLKIDGIRVPMDQIFPAVSSAKNGNVSPEAVFFFSAKYSYDPGEKIIEIAPMIVESPDIGKLDFQLQLTNIDMRNIDMNNPMASIPAMFGVFIHDATIRYEDYSFLKSSVNGSGPEGADSFRAVIRMVIHAVERELRGETDPMTKKTLSEVKAFLENPERIQIRVFPGDPVPLGRLLWVRSAGELIRVLSVRVETG